jgi:deazaflavin-dependent oxidoreductase (nitroreductase family)
VVTNPVARRVAGRLPGFAIVTHVGRRSGRTYRTPVNLFRADGRYVIALTYGSESQWVRNVLAAGECEVETRGERIHLVGPELVHDPGRALVPAPVRSVLSVLDVDDFMVLANVCAARGRVVEDRPMRRRECGWRQQVKRPARSPAPRTRTTT